MTENTRVSTDALAAAIPAHQVTSLILFDRDLKILYMNPAAEMLLSVSARMARGLSLSQVIRCSRDVFDQHLGMVVESNQPITERGISLSLPDGHSITVDCTLAPVEFEDPETCVLAEIRRVDRQLRVTREEQLITQNLATRDLVRGMAHEIKNPLGGMRGAAQLLAMELGEDSELGDYTRIIVEEVDRLKSLVDQMLGSRQLPVMGAVNIHHILERVYTIVSSDPEHSIAFERDYDPSIPDLQADEGQLVQAILNIVQNAVQATGSKGTVLLQTRVLRQFTLAGVRHRLVLQINIVDDGPGIPQELQERVFYPMVSGKSEGTGLGLSLAQSMINRHGGLIEFTSTPGKTVFTIYLPLEQCNE
ncbi:nitrogen regulation protein NR(II) [Thiolapillus brandeum]|uniref:Sensory histidine kinase/phosphatase NtrB n=1 Tax=Thiolapillus brandeum TaxID=1076588 RepID=A0A7U6GGQ5_9GAMM|nr:nitrogen regulation protein NR(II) [Thiolapillus brandeum]BAO43275.1 two-component system NtrC family nitrogen regulation sensor histidine kinase [Thiolapillus brandeum]